MKQLIFFLIFIATVFSARAQKIYAVVNINAPFSYLNYTNGHNKVEFVPSVVKINGNWGIDVFYKPKKLTHRLSIQQVQFGFLFKLINKFMLPPNRDNLSGFNYSSFGNNIDHFIVSYALQKEGKHNKGFLFKSKIRFNYSGGLGISLNRSKSYYKEVFPNSSFVWTNPWTYDGYYADHYRDGFGVFLRGTGGFDILNKKGKRKICFNVFYNQGLKDMAHFDIQYKYGYYNDPSRQVAVPKQVLRTRGTNIGFSLGIPITIKK
ncbi:MAG: hypothetical protein LH615_00590 [Ferruginibacter sp.]|nr:hypothetical protein [Ferruginibacter sp.]